MLSGVNRTSIVRMINANRLPEQQNIEKLIPFLKLTPDQTKELWRTYEIISSGEQLYERRQFMLSMVKRIFHPEFSSPKLYKSNGAPPKTGTNVNLRAGHIILKGRYEVAHSLILASLNQPDDDICVFAPFTSDFISDFFKHLSSKGSKTLHIRHLMHFIKNPAQPKEINFNLQILSNVLPLAFTDLIDYHAYYTYVQHPLVAESQILHPYYIIMGDLLIHLAIDFEAAVFINIPDVVKEYRDYFNLNVSEAQQLVRSGDNLKDLAEYFPPSVIKRSGFCKMGKQPWLFSMFELSTAVKIIPGNKEVKTTIDNIVSSSTDNGKRIDAHISFFSSEGLIEFAKNGKILNFPEKFVKHIPTKYRLNSLKMLRDHVTRDGYMVRVLNDNFFRITTNIAIQITHDNHVGISVFDDNHDSYRFFFMNEPTLMDAFIDFLEYAANSPFLCSNIVCSQDETIALIDDCIEKLKSGEYK
ncbi:MAG: hypothetical protein K6G84_15735 [Lachnospiraceae bacterium]|nr:hypothetical protein [Lachnospiraceae bacterium]